MREKLSTHKIGYCQNCGWVHDIVERVRELQGDTLTIKALCHSCLAKLNKVIICQNCGVSHGEQLLPVSILRKKLDGDHTCNLFLHLCQKCRKIPHEELLKTIQLPGNICDTCKDKFTCYTNAQDNLPDGEMDYKSGLIKSVTKRIVRAWRMKNNARG
jgi:hypothetical protein